jgi:hypothetical protein
VVDLMSACLLGGRLDGAAGAPGAPRAGGWGKQARAHAPPLLPAPRRRRPASGASLTGFGCLTCPQPASSHAEASGVGGGLAHAGYACAPREG